MSKNKWMLIITLLFTSLACGLLANVQNGVQQIQSAATQLPGLTADQQGRGLIDAGKLAPRVLAAASY